MFRVLGIYNSALGKELLYCNTGKICIPLTFPFTPYLLILSCQRCLWTPTNSNIKSFSSSLHSLSSLQWQLLQPRGHASMRSIGSNVATQTVHKQALKRKQRQVIGFACLVNLSSCRAGGVWGTREEGVTPKVAWEPWLTAPSCVRFSSYLSCTQYCALLLPFAASIF